MKTSDLAMDSGSTWHVDQLNFPRKNREIDNEESSVPVEFTAVHFEQALRELIELAKVTVGDEWDSLQRRYDVALKKLFPSMNQTQRAALLKADNFAATVEDWFADARDRATSDQVSQSRSLEWHLLGCAALEHDRVDLAKVCFERGVNLRFESGRLPELASVRHLANINLQEDNAIESQKYLEMVRKLDPRDTETLHRLALLQEKQGRLEQSISLLESAIKLEPNRAIYHADLGAIFIRAGRLESAKKELDQAVFQGYDHAEVLMNRSIVYYLNGSIGDAIASLEDVVDRYPADPAPRRLLAKLRARD